MTAEADLYDDLIIGDFEDSYDNLPLKTFLGFQFFAEFCHPNKKYVYFHDSDAFVMVPQSIEDYRAQEEAAKDLHPWSQPVYLQNDSIYCIKAELNNEKRYQLIYLAVLMSCLSQEV